MWLDVLNLFNESNVLSTNQNISLASFDITDPAFGVITDSEATLPNAYALAMGRFQQNGAPGILNFINDTPNPLYNLVNSFQAPREFRFGVRFMF